MSTVPWLDPANTVFPASEYALDEPNGLLAVGGDLSPARLISAYRLGIFPWYEDPQPILWWTPSPRAVLFPDKVIVSRSLRKRIRRGDYQVSCDTAFNRVVCCCANVPRKDQDGTWISQSILDAYQRLHEMGIAHSVEVWFEGQLVGGLYGISLGQVFFGESMFSTRSDASKVALVYLAKQLQEWGYGLIDCQVTNPHLLSLGAEEIDRAEFSHLLRQHIDQPGPVQWPTDWSVIGKSL